ncbi:MAG: site-2 protease family protein [Dehalococcoidia bacterium]
MKSSFRLTRIAGIDIGIHYTWILIFVLLTWSLARAFFPQMYPGWGTVTYWITGVVAALLLFGSVLLHELAHCLVARARGMSVHSITLFLLGGVSNLEDEPEKPRIELAVSIVGPLTSLALAGICWGLLQLAGDQQGPVAGMLAYLALINAILAAFNLLPGFPLDGGRVLRSILWEKTGSLVKATNIAATVGRFMGWGIIAFGLFQVFAGNLGGLWLAFIGWFLSSSADASRRELVMRQQLSGVRVRDVMAANPTTISPDTTVSGLVSNVLRRQISRAVPVCQNEKVLGIATVTDVKELPPEKWADTPVSAIMTRDPLYRVRPEDDLNTVMKLITKHDVNQVLVMDDNKCAGIVNRADILNYLHLSEELGLKRKGG